MCTHTRQQGKERKRNEAAIYLAKSLQLKVTSVQCLCFPSEINTAFLGWHDAYTGYSFHKYLPKKKTENKRIRKGEVRKKERVEKRKEIMTRKVFQSS